MHELALWVESAAGDVSFVETSNAPGKPVAARGPDLVGGDRRGNGRDTHRRAGRWSRVAMVFRVIHSRSRYLLAPTSAPAALAICKINNIGILKSRIHIMRVTHGTQLITLDLGD